MTAYSGGNTTKITFNKGAYIQCDGNDLGFVSEITFEATVPAEPLPTANTNFVPNIARRGMPTAMATFTLLETSFDSGNWEKVFQLASKDGGTALAQGSAIKGTQTTYWANFDIIPLDDQPGDRIRILKGYFVQDGPVEFNDNDEPISLSAQFHAIVDTSESDTEEDLWKIISTSNTTDLTISSSTPADAATSVAVDSTIVMNFSEAVGKSYRDNFADYVAVAEADGTHVTITNAMIAWDSDYDTVTITPSSNLTSSTVHIVQVAPGVRSSAGAKYLAGDGSNDRTWHEFDFTTA